MKELAFPWVPDEDRDAKACGEYLARAIEQLFWLDRTRWRFFRHGERPHDRENGHQYRRKIVLGRNMSEHRMIWIITHRELPAAGMEIDHINRDKRDNRIENLRLVTRTQNQRNKARTSANRTGFIGVSFKDEPNRTNKYMAFVYDKTHRFGGKNRIVVGYFFTAEEAARARDEFCRRVDPHHWRLNADENPERLAGVVLSEAASATVDECFSKLIERGGPTGPAASRRDLMTIFTDRAASKRTGIAGVVQWNQRTHETKCIVRIAHRLSPDLSEADRTIAFPLGRLTRREARRVGQQKCAEARRELLDEAA